MMYGSEKTVDSKPATLSACEVFTDRASKRRNNELACNLGCAKFVLDFTSEYVCVVLLRGLLSESLCCVLNPEGDYKPLCVATVSPRWEVLI